MDIFQVFFWFCKEQKIMDIMFKMYHEGTLGRWNYKDFSCYFEPLSLREYIETNVNAFGLHDIFSWIQPCGSDLPNNQRYKKARSKWYAFSKNNIKFSEDFVKIGDEVEVDIGLGTIRKGIVVEIPKEFCGVFIIMEEAENAVLKVRISSFDSANTFKVNGEIRTPKYCIKRKRKIYGADKR